MSQGNVTKANAIVLLQWWQGVKYISRFKRRICNVFEHCRNQQIFCHGQSWGILNVYYFNCLLLSSISAFLYCLLSFLKDDEIPNDEKYNIDGTYVPRIFFIGKGISFWWEGFFYNTHIL